MLPTDSLVFPVLFELAVSVLASGIAIAGSLVYLHRVRLERPAVGTFNGRDIVVLFAFIVGLPLLYAVLPLTPLLVALGITFASALSIGLRPMLGPNWTWPVVGLLLGADVWLTRTTLGTVTGWQLFWLENSLVVLLAAVVTANLYVQGGMRLRHVAWFSLVLAGYDVVFTFVWPITNVLTQRFIGWPFDPAVGFRLGLYNASLGLGDLLAYALFVAAVAKAYGGRATWLAAAVAVVFGAVVPALVPLLTRVFLDARTDLVVPAQTAFGPAAFLTYRWLRRRYGPERTVAAFLTGLEQARRAPAEAPGSRLPRLPLRRPESIG